MIIKDIHFTLRDGREAVIRSPRDEDAESMLHYLCVSSGETDFLLRYPEECKPYTVEDEKKLFAQKNESEHQAMLVCLVDGKVAGSCVISVYTEMKMKHRAAVAIALLREYWNQGIGTRMLQEMIHIAESFEDIIQIELEYVEGNIRARHLYEKMGFRITGVRLDAIRLKNGSLLNEYMMVKKIK